MKKHRLLVMFFITVLLQLTTPLYMAWRWENILQTGQLFYWETAPVDPYDAFRGRYIDLNFKHTQGQVVAGEQLEYGQTAFALISEAEGKAYLTSVSPQRPPEGAYVKVRVHYVDGNTVHVSLPFKRYYLPEHIAPAAESAYRENAEASVAAVRIKDGLAVIEEIYLGDKTLTDYLQNAR